jgi:hypothetical protein
MESYISSRTAIFLLWPHQIELSVMHWQTDKLEQLFTDCQNNRAVLLDELGAIPDDNFLALWQGFPRDLEEPHCKMDSGLRVAILPLAKINSPFPQLFQK